MAGRRRHPDPRDNFDEETIRYLQYSSANKAPEYLASGAAVLAYGPGRTATISFMSESGAAVVVDTPDRAALAREIESLVSNGARRAAIGERARSIAFSAFELDRQRQRFVEALRVAAGQEAVREAPADPARATREATPKSKTQLDECRLVFEAAGAADFKGVMIDVGAHFGSSLRRFANAGWSVYAFEPDPANLAKLLPKVAGQPNVVVSEEAVSDVSGVELPLYASHESTGISGLSAFRDTHREVARVKTVTLDDVVARRGLTRIDFLKIDVEGFEIAVLRGLDFTRLSPEVVLAEYEDDKTGPQGYDVHELSRFLTDRGYTVYVSEWYPIERYSVKHSFRRFRPYPCDVPSTSWGNLIAFKTDPSTEILRSAVRAAADKPVLFEDEEAAPPRPMPEAPVEPAVKETPSRSTSPRSGAPISYRIFMVDAPRPAASLKAVPARPAPLAGGKPQGPKLLARPFTAGASPSATVLGPAFAPGSGPTPKALSPPSSVAAGAPVGGERLDRPFTAGASPSATVLGPAFVPGSDPTPKALSPPSSVAADAPLGGERLAGRPRQAPHRPPLCSVPRSSPAGPGSKALSPASSVAADAPLGGEPAAVVDKSAAAPLAPAMSPAATPLPKPPAVDRQAAAPATQKKYVRLRRARSRILRLIRRRPVAVAVFGLLAAVLGVTAVSLALPAGWLPATSVPPIYGSLASLFLAGLIGYAAFAFGLIRTANLRSALHKQERALSKIRSQAKNASIHNRNRSSCGSASSNGHWRPGAARCRLWKPQVADRETSRGDGSEACEGPRDARRAKEERGCCDGLPSRGAGGAARSRIGSKIANLSAELNTARLDSTKKLESSRAAIVSDAEEDAATAMQLDMFAAQDSNEKKDEFGKLQKALELRVVEQTREFRIKDGSNARSRARSPKTSSLVRLEEHWGPLLNLRMDASQLRELGRQLRLAEDLCNGRLATTIETAMLRLLAFRSLGRPDVEVIEVGTNSGSAPGCCTGFAAMGSRESG